MGLMEKIVSVLVIIAIVVLMANSCDPPNFRI
nr:MAG TPA: envelope protein [Caudoviricetes sp.]